MRKNTDIKIISTTVPLATTVPFPVSKAVAVAIALLWAGKKQQNGDISIVVKDQQDVAGKIIL